MKWYEESGSRNASVRRIGTRDKTTCDVKFRCTGTYDDQEVHGQAAMFFNANRFYDINGQTLLVQNYDLAHLGGDAWEVTAHYESMGEDSEPDPMKRSRSFDTTGGTTHINCGFSERRYGPNAADMKAAINADGEEIKGVDIIIPALQWQEQYDVANGFVTEAYVRTLSSLTGCVNDAAFRGFAEGEVLFAGCSGTQQWDEEKGNGPWNLSYKFVASSNANNLTVGDIQGIAKKGHEYLWVKFEDAVQNNALIRKPKAVYVNEVYRKEDFALLGLG